ncbi:hypothetical protein ACWC9H_27270 [Streptomyces sp. NPDC001251]
MITIDGRDYLTRADIHDQYGYSTTALETWWADRANNDHPPARKVGRFLYWDAREWAEWDHDRINLVGAVEFARILGHGDHTRITHAAIAPPPGFPAPTRWGDPAARRRPKWSRAAAEEYARTQPTEPPRRGGRRPGSATGSHPYAGDPRLALARRLITQHPDARTGELISRLTELSDEPASRSTWIKILKSARTHLEP